MLFWLLSLFAVVAKVGIILVGADVIAVFASVIAEIDSATRDTGTVSRQLCPRFLHVRLQLCRLQPELRSQLLPFLAVVSVLPAVSVAAAAAAAADAAAVRR